MSSAPERAGAYVEVDYKDGRDDVFAIRAQRRARGHGNVVEDAEALAMVRERMVRAARHLCRQWRAAPHACVHGGHLNLHPGHIDLTSDSLSLVKSTEPNPNLAP